MPESLKNLKIDVSQSIIFIVVFVVISVLVGLDKMPADKLELLLMMLIPSPIKKDVPKES